MHVCKKLWPPGIESLKSTGLQSKAPFPEQSQQPLKIVSFFIMQMSSLLKFSLDTTFTTFLVRLK